MNENSRNIIQLTFEVMEDIIISKERYIMDQYGKAILNLDELIKEKGISKTQLSYKAEISHTQINRFCKNDVTRIDLNTIARLCHVLNCTVADLIKYEPPQ